METTALETELDALHVGSGTLDIPAIDFLELSDKLNLGQPKVKVRYCQATDGEHKFLTGNISQECAKALQATLGEKWKVEIKEKIVPQKTSLAKRIKRKYNVRGIRLITNGRTVQGIVFFHMKDRIVEKGAEIVASLKAAGIMAREDKTCICFSGLTNY